MRCFVLSAVAGTLAVVIGFGVPGMAGAQEQGTDGSTPASNEDLVAGCRQSESVILRIEACTRLIEAREQGGGESNPAWAFNNRALAYERTGRLERALSDLNTALLLDPEYAVGYNNRGNLHFRMGNLEAAIADHAQAVEIRPDYLAGWSNLGADYRAVGDLEDAVAALDKALEIEPDNLPALTDRAAALCTLGRVDASVADRLKLLELGRFSATELQEFLKARGFYESAIDGIFGRGSRAALRAWTAAGCPRN